MEYLRLQKIQNGEYIDNEKRQRQVASVGSVSDGCGIATITIDCFRGKDLSEVKDV